MPRKKIDVLEVWPKGKEIDLPRYSFGAVCKILGLEPWRLQKFLDSPRYQLKASGQIGEGRGSRKWFGTEDIYRIGIASLLARDGFAPKFIAAILQGFDDRDLLEWDENGDQVRAGFIALVHTKTGGKDEHFPPERPPEIRVGGPVYYVLDVGKVTEEIDRRIEQVMNKKGRR